MQSILDFIHSRLNACKPYSSLPCTISLAQKLILRECKFSSYWLHPAVLRFTLGSMTTTSIFCAHIEHVPCWRSNSSWSHARQTSTLTLVLSLWHSCFIEDTRLVEWRSHSFNYNLICRPSLNADLHVQTVTLKSVLGCPTGLSSLPDF